MSALRRLLVVGGCLICLLAVTSALPAADPRIEVPVPEIQTAETNITNSTETIDINRNTGTLDEYNEINDDSTVEETDGVGTGGETVDPDKPEIVLDGAALPGETVDIGVENVRYETDVTVEVDGERVGETGPEGELSVTVPYEDQMTIAVPAYELTRRVPIQSNVGVAVEDRPLPGRSVDLNTTVGPSPFVNASVLVDGEQVAQTNQRGNAMVELPETAGETTVRVERGEIGATRQLALPGIEMSLERSLFILPGMFNRVTVTADGEPVQGAAVSVNGERATETESDGDAVVQLPLADQATISASVGAESATTSVGGLYLRLTAVVVLVPGFVIGFVLTGLRLVPHLVRALERFSRKLEEQEFGSRGWNILMVGAVLAGIAVAVVQLLAAIVGAFVAVAVAIRAFVASVVRGEGITLSWPSVTVPEFRWPSLPRLQVGVFDNGEESGAANGPEDTPEEDQPGPRAEIRLAWHRFVDRVDVKRRETKTPGQIAREAVRAGFPTESVRLLVGTFRDVEYGDREPTMDRVTDARAASRNLTDGDGDGGEAE